MDMRGQLEFGQGRLISRDRNRSYILQPTSVVGNWNEIELP